ncbi:unnamed protein product [Oikopleura dioica]|uniref:EGF-like domain-containing protein n=1 Tax=Oikopleura dioica TaxID=34765 RepID=E4XS32_OIKDI|nr:unnamed protein product [Oikopleura dioica]
MEVAKEKKLTNVFKKLTTASKFATTKLTVFIARVFQNVQSKFKFFAQTCGDINECDLNACDEVTQICKNSAGSFKCECRRGFENIAEGTGPACQDINECEMANNCSLNSECVNSFGSYSCSCLSGYKKNEALQEDALESEIFFDKCIDIDECEEPELSCPDSNSYCVNFEGSFECSCLRGFVLENGNCKSRRVNECLLGTHSCDVNAECLDTKNGFNCLCFSGFIGDGFFCDDMDECALRKGDENYCENILENSKCVNTFGSFECKCNSGFILKNEKCVDVDECSSFSKICPRNSNCVNTAGSAFCECEKGFEMNENGFCDDLNECESEKYRCDENAKCINTDGSFKCDCRAGFILKNGRAQTCGDINECDTNACDEVTQICKNSAGSFKCECRRGFENIAEGTGPACQDINECEMANNCSLNSECVNFFGSYSCSCLSGYKKNEELQEDALESEIFFDKCIDIDECEEPELSCPDSNSYCVNIDNNASKIFQILKLTKTALSSIW